MIRNLMLCVLATACLLICPSMAPAQFDPPERESLPQGHVGVGESVALGRPERI
jgi:hypothetical protein